MLVAAIITSFAIVSFIVGFAWGRVDVAVTPARSSMTYAFHLRRATIPSRKVTLTIIIVLVCYLGMNTILLLAPATNDPIFTDRGRVQVGQQRTEIKQQHTCRNIVDYFETMVCKQVPVSISRHVTVLLDFPAKVAVHREFHVSANAVSNPPFPARTYRAELHKPPARMDARTSDPCKRDQPVDPSVSAACVLAGMIENLRFRWTLTPKSTGDSELLIKSDLFRFQRTSSVDPGGRIQVEYNGKTGVIYDDNPTMNVEGINVDGQRGEIRFPVTIRTTIGVSQATYDWAIVVGAIISVLTALFGCWIRRQSVL